MRTFNILHIFSDEKFFDSTSLFFDSLSNVNNIYAYYLRQKDYKFKYINRVDRLLIIKNLFDYLKLLRSSHIDIIYFHSLYPVYYIYFLFIPKNKIIIWWSWGYDLYNSFSYIDPLIKLQLYKPKTSLLREKYLNNGHSTKKLLRTLLSRIFNLIRKKIISRVNFFTPVIENEYFLLKSYCNFFNAKPFMLKSGPGLPLDFKEQFCVKNQNILVGNSLTWENNLIDIYHILQELNLDYNRKFICPISYGNDYGGRDAIKREFSKQNVLWLEGFIPKDEYFEIFNSVSHAIFGILRQQAMSNIYNCLVRGVKLYLYKDSIVYKYLISKGYIVFTIDDDLNSISLNSVLPMKDALHNHHLVIQRRENIVEDTEFELSKIFDNKL